MEMGLGPIGQPNVILKRKFRWTLAIEFPCGKIPTSTCRTAARPKLDIEENEINFLNAVTWLPGKAKWQPITVTYYDVANLEDPNGSPLQGILNWIDTIYDLTNPTNLQMSEKSGWAGTAILTMFDGCGTPIEGWQLGSVWPQSIDFGELDYSSGDYCTIDLTLRYSEVKYIPFCKGPTPTGCCGGC